MTDLIPLYFVHVRTGNIAGRAIHHSAKGEVVAHLDPETRTIVFPNGDEASIDSFVKFSRVAKKAPSSGAQE